MSDLSKQLTPNELDKLDDFLLNRIDDNEDTRGKDEGIYDVSSLDGLFTAIVSAPVMVPPSRWLPVIWGDYEPEWKNEKEFTVIFSMMMRHMNSIIDCLTNTPELYEPLFLGRDIDGKEILIVDDWCTGYIKGIDLSYDDLQNDTELKVLLSPIAAFGTESGWDALEKLNKQEQKNIGDAIVPNVREIYAYWRDNREQEITTQKSHSTFRRDTPKVSRNDPCPCGSGKKYKKCCLH